MVLREKGEILFLDRGASELTGFQSREGMHLQDLLAGVFPDQQDQAKAQRLFRRAAATAGRRGSARFHADFSSKTGHRGRTAIQVQRCGGEPGDRSYLVSFLPVSSRAPLDPRDRSAVLHQLAQRVVRLLNGAAACSAGLAADFGGADERFAVLSALIERAKGLLGSLEAQATGAPLGDTEERK
jgi:hypothetical protein